MPWPCTCAPPTAPRSGSTRAPDASARTCSGPSPTSARRAFWPARRAARASCSTRRRSSAASACGSARFPPARAAGTGMSSASGVSTPRPARQPMPRRSSSIHPEDQAKLNYVDSTARAGRYAQRYRVLHRDGTTRWIHSQWEVKNGPDGKPDRAIGIMMDDTEAYDSARALGDVSAQLKMAVDLGDIAIWRHDLRSQRIYYSDKAFELLQMTPRPEGMNIEEIRALIHPEDLPQVLASAEQALLTDQPTDMEARYRRMDGSYRYVMTRRRGRARRRGPAAGLRRRRARRDRNGRASASCRRAGASSRGRLAGRRRGPVDDGARSRGDRLEPADVRHLRSLHRAARARLHRVADTKRASRRPGPRRQRGAWLPRQRRRPVRA